MTQQTTLRNRIIIPLLGALLVAALATFFLVQRQIETRLVAEFDDALMARARLLASLTAFEEVDLEENEPEPFLEFDFEAEFMPEFSDPDSAAWFQLWADGEPFARSGSLATGELPRDGSNGAEPKFGNIVGPTGVESRLLTWSIVPYLDEEWGDEPANRITNVGRRYPDLTLPRVQMAVAISRAELDETLAFIAATLGGGLLLLLALVGGAVALLVPRGLRPLNALVGQLDEVTSDELDRRLPEDELPRELTPVATTVNALLMRLERSFQRERQFSRNIAHELRTPIAELRSIGEVGERWPDDPDASRQFFTDIVQIGNRMDLMVTNLLTMARQESGQMECAWEALDLTSALDNIGTRFRSECEKNGIRLDRRGPPSTQVMADRIYLDIIASNLVSNAINHGCGDVAIDIYSEGTTAGFLVENPAELDEEDLPFLFDRFWRKDTARAAGNHAGLGLALVKSLATACSWSVRAELERGNRLRVRVDGIRVS